MTDGVESAAPAGNGAAKELSGPPESKQHIYYGKVSEAGVPSVAAVCEEIPAGYEELPVGAAGSSPDADPDNSADAAVQQHAERLKAFQIQQTASSFKTVAPTIDADVRDALR